MSTVMARPSRPPRDNRRADMEQIMDTNGLKWEFAPQLRWSDIVPRLDLQVRDHTNPGVIALYAVKLQNGAIFPPLLVAESKTEAGKYDLIHGNHRYGAQGKYNPQGFMDAYILTNLDDDDAAKFASSLFNVGHGLPYTKEERKQIALLMKQKNYTLEKIAQDLGIPPAQTRSLLAAADFEQRCETLDLDGDDILTTTKQHLNRVRLDNAFRELVSLTRDAKLNSTEVNEIVKVIDQAKSEQEMLKEIAHERSERALVIKDIAAGKDASKPPSLQANRLIGGLLKLAAQYPNMTDWLPAKSESRAEWRLKVQAFHEHMSDLLAAYEANG